MKKFFSVLLLTGLFIVQHSYIGLTRPESVEVMVSPGVVREINLSDENISYEELYTFTKIEMSVDAAGNVLSFEEQAPRYFLSRELFESYFGENYFALDNLELVSTNLEHVPFSESQMTPGNSRRNSRNTVDIYLGVLGDGFPEITPTLSENFSEPNSFQANDAVFQPFATREAFAFILWGRSPWTGSQTRLFLYIDRLIDRGTPVAFTGTPQASRKL